jgi:Spy/CpxP family protein refolding chaperone
MNKTIAIVAAGLIAAAAATQVADANPGAGYGPGWGPGPGMMGGGGPGFMGGGWGALPADLSADQRTKIFEIQRDMRAKQWPLMQQMHETMWAGAAQDEQAERQAYDRLATLQKQVFENMLDARKRIDAVLTPQQRDEVKRGWGPH